MIALLFYIILPFDYEITYLCNFVPLGTTHIRHYRTNETVTNAGLLLRQVNQD